MEQRVLAWRKTKQNIKINKFYRVTFRTKITVYNTVAGF